MHLELRDVAVNFGRRTAASPRDATHSAVKLIAAKVMQGQLFNQLIHWATFEENDYMSF